MLRIGVLQMGETRVSFLIKKGRKKERHRSASSHIVENFEQTKVCFTSWYSSPFSARSTTARRATSPPPGMSESSRVFGLGTQPRGTRTPESTEFHVISE